MNDVLVARLPTEAALYSAAWIAWLVLAPLAVRRRPAEYEFLGRAYWRFLAEPWRLATFALATATITLAAPYSGDPTWDLPDSLLISATTYALTPWAIAALGRRALGLGTRTTGAARGIVAIGALLLPCWTYDVYIYARDGYYPASWAPNVVLSGAICVLAGLFWNLGKPGGGSARSVLTFTAPEWPPRDPTPLGPVLAPAALLGLPVAAGIAAFVYDALVGF